jgi:hypothetical protein
MIRSIVTATFLVFLMSTAAVARQRVASHSSECALTVTPRSFNVPAAGGANTIVVGRVGPCKWAPEPSADWVTINTISISEGLITFTVSPNTGTTARNATIDIGAVIITITQAAPEIRNLLVNGTFDRDIAGWSPLFSTGSGSGTWSALDAHDSLASGSARVQSTQGGLGYQLLQCVNVLPNRTYEYGLTSRIASGQDPAGRVILGVYEYDVADCNKVGYNFSAPSTINPGLNTWTPFASVFRTSDSAKSIYFVVAAGFHKTPPFAINFDDAFFREKQ